MAGSAGRAFQVLAAAACGLLLVVMLAARMPNALTPPRARTPEQKRNEIPPTPSTIVEVKHFPDNYDFALEKNGATAEGGKDPQLLIDGNSTDYGGGTGFATAYWKFSPPQPFTVTLKEPYRIGCVRFLLWDLNDQRYYRYKLEISPDKSGKNWITVADRSAATDECRGWQTIVFDLQPVQQIRLTGTYNSSNSAFHVVELQAFQKAPPEPAKSGTPGGMDF